MLFLAHQLGHAVTDGDAPAVTTLGSSMHHRLRRHLHVPHTVSVVLAIVLLVVSR